MAAKASSETELLEKFSQLLNTKKAKIRDLEMQMGGSKFEAPAREVTPSVPKRREEEPVVERKKAGPSRKGKRKAVEPEPEPEPEPELEEEVETTDEVTTEDEKQAEDEQTTEDEGDEL